MSMLSERTVKASTEKIKTSFRALTTMKKNGLYKPETYIKRTDMEQNTEAFTSAVNTYADYLISPSPVEVKVAVAYALCKYFAPKSNPVIKLGFATNEKLPTYNSDKNLLQSDPFIMNYGVVECEGVKYEYTSLDVSIKDLEIGRLVEVTLTDKDKEEN